ncbi:RimJ/RimL family protein N-acetyltransferase [Thermocatellispora tengchongensis]|uniref:RimJ/RimL family protein N-acetyltransferase n=1 Tax=Thermocatellispora tengchongensis TaxID=1073253 RepID=A0A840P6S3_9ACTN|nr:GNAT family N-acetyltransferase [Thermocatellispora tengchongensis]MBB5137034.1 RimJ/RimL family protein N-acetyltransferase [Thermocatellispora tengchongensis]
MLKPDFPLRTERLILRPFTDGDLEALHAFHRLPEVTRYLYWEPRDRAQTRAALKEKATRTTLTDDNHILSLAVERRDTGELIGDCMLHHLSREHAQGEIGFVFHPAHHGHGYATEAGRELLRLGFDELGLHRIIGRCDARNTASAAVLARLGMRREAHLRENEFFKGQWSDELIYAMLHREWTATR